MKSGSSQERQLLCVHEGSAHPVSWTQRGSFSSDHLGGLDIYAEPVTFDLQGELSPVQRSWLCAELEELWVVWCVFNKLAARAESLVWDGWRPPWTSVWPASSSPTPALPSAAPALEAPLSLTVHVLSAGSQSGQTVSVRRRAEPEPDLQRTHVSFPPAAFCFSPKSNQRSSESVSKRVSVAASHLIRSLINNGVM